MDLLFIYICSYNVRIIFLLVMPLEKFKNKTMRILTQSRQYHTIVRFEVCVIGWATKILHLLNTGRILDFIYISVYNFFIGIWEGLVVLWLNYLEKILDANKDGEPIWGIWGEAWVYFILDRIVGSVTKVPYRLYMGRILSL